MVLISVLNVLFIFYRLKLKGFENFEFMSFLRPPGEFESYA